MKVLTIDITGKCNIDCEFCYSEKDNNQLNKNQIMGIINENKEFDTIEIGGGEPLLHPEITGIIKDLTRKGKRIHISTNGIIIPEDFLNLEDLIKKNLTLQVGLPSVNPENYKKITGKDYLDIVLNNIKKIKEKNYFVVINSPIYAGNFSEVDSILDTAYNLSVPIRMGLILPEGKGKNVELLDKYNLRTLKNKLLLARIKNRNLVDSPLIHESSCPVLEKVYGITQTKKCAIDSSDKKYYNQRGVSFNCEFYRGLTNVNN